MNIDDRRTASISFDGVRARSGPLTWGQAKMFTELLDFFHGEALAHIPVDLALPAGVTEARVLAALGELVARHESLRTTYPADDVQRVHGAGHLPVEVVEIGNADPAAAAAELDAEYGARPFDLPREFAARWAVLTRAGRPVRLAGVISHFAVDGISTDVLAGRLTGLLTGAADTPEPATWQPLDLAGHQLSPAGRRQSAATAAYWAQAYRDAPATMFAEAAAGGPPPEGQRYRQGTLVSPAVAAALPAITARTRASRSAVVLAGCLTLLARRAGLDRGAVVSIAANRTRTETQAYVGQLAQDALIVVDLAGADTFDEVVARTWRASLTAYAHSQIDPADLAAAGGAGFARDCVYNDHVAYAPTTPAAAPPPRAAPGAPAVTVVPHEFIPVRGYLTVHRLDPVTEVSLWADTAYLPERDLESFLWDLDRLLTAAAETADVRAVAGRGN